MYVWLMDGALRLYMYVMRMALLRLFLRGREGSGDEEERMLQAESDTSSQSE